jgi:hypothetical protein
MDHNRIAGLQFLLPAIQRISDKLERAAIAEEVAGYLRIERGLVLDHFRKAATERREKSLAQTRELPRPVERILLNALLASEEARKSVLPKLKGISECERFVTRGIFQALFQIAESGAPFRFAELEARLADKDREVLAAVIFEDKPDEEEYSLEQALACLSALEQADRDTVRAALKTRIKEAERAGMLKEALRITEELGRLDRN